MIIMTLLRDILSNKMYYASHPLADLMRPNFTAHEFGIIVHANHNIFWARNTTTQLLTSIIQSAFMNLYGCTLMTLCVLRYKLKIN